MTKADLIHRLLPPTHPQKANGSGRAFAPSNIALCKYWGKRDALLNLPMTSSVSISLGSKGAHCVIQECTGKHQITVNHTRLPDDHEFVEKLAQYLAFFNPSSAIFYDIQFEFNIPIAAGVASSACSFAALTLALNDLYQWHLDKKTLSILARLGSGSACRSLWNGFVLWEKGVSADGMDSHGTPLPVVWPEFCIGLHLITENKKPISSRAAMLSTVNTATFYPLWPRQIAHDLPLIMDAILHQKFEILGTTAESNALSLHALMMNSTPPIVYSLPETLAAMHTIWALRQAGHAIYFTQDAGANLKLLFLTDALTTVRTHFPNIQVIHPFQGLA